MLQRSNSVRDKDHRKSMLECTGNTPASGSLNRQRSFALSKTRILHSILHPYFLNDHALFLCSRLGWIRAVSTAWQKTLLSDALLLYSQFPVVKRDYGNVGSFHIKDSRRRVFWRSSSLQKIVFRGFPSSGNFIAGFQCHAIQNRSK